MNSKQRCHICYQDLEHHVSYHPHCLKKLFNSVKIPELTFNRNDFESLALELIRHKAGLPGVQQKISLSLITLKENEHVSKRLTVVGYLGGEYILKPATVDYPQMPEIEDLTMHLAAIANIGVASHGLVLMNNGELAYITKRFDRIKGQKIAVEDLCQLSQKLTEHKYKSSHEKIAKVIARYAAVPGDALLKFFEIIIFSFLVGNADMHLKNFSLITEDPSKIVLAPCYDLLSTRLLIPEHRDPEELALPLNGKKRNFYKKDFVEFGKNIGIPEKVIHHTMKQMITLLPQWDNMINRSFLNENLQTQYRALISKRADILIP